MYLSIKDLKILAEFRFVQILQLCTHLLAPQTSDFLEKVALIFLYNFHREHSLLKLNIKKLLPKINVKNIKKINLDRNNFLYI